MISIKLKINERTGKGKVFMQFLKEFLKEDKSIEILEEKSPYNPKFVKMVNKSAARKKRYSVDNVDDLWERL